MNSLNMKSLMSKLALGLSLLMLSLHSLASGQFYFIGKAAPVGAASMTGQQTQGVYLRWDVLEGELPADVQNLRLTRTVAGGSEEILGEWAANSTMTETEVYRLFNATSQQQRLLEMVTALKEVTLSELNEPSLNRPATQDFEVNTYAAALIQRLQNDVFWSYLASRQNFNIAQVRRRAYLDTSVQADTIYDYSLYAVNDAQTALLGKTRVNTGGQYALLPVRALRQLPVADQCDSTRDHYTVALDWLAPGNHATDRVANNIQLAGYEIYRAKTDLGDELPDRDLAEEAKALSHNARGELEFEGLEKVSKSLLMLEGAASETEVGSRDAEFIENRQALMQAGLKPGDRRVYYVVSRDFAGHYGSTQKVLVQVPYMLPPEQPWQLESRFLNEEEGGIALSWDHVNFKNFQLNNPGQVFCQDNPVNGIVEYAQTQAQCDSPLTSRIDVTGYQVYRFETFSEARRFKDSDGDGVADVDEYAGSNQCNALQQPESSTSHRVVDAEFRSLNATRERVEFRDQDSALQTGKVYWYRIVSRTADQRFSLPTAPIRVLVPDLTAPAAPTVKVEQLATSGCCQLETIDANAELWSFADNVGGYSLAIEEVGEQSPAFSSHQFGNWASDLCRNEQSAIEPFWGTRTDGAGSRVLKYGRVTAGQENDGKKAAFDELYCEVDIPGQMDLCKSGSWALQPATCEVLEPLEGGDLTSGPVRVTITAGDEDSCVEYYDTVAGIESLIHTSCGSDTPGILEFDVDGGFVCGSAIARDASNNASASIPLPCTLAGADEPPSPPQLLTLDSGGESLQFSWRTPLQPTSVTLIEIRSDVDAEDASDTDVQLLTFPNAGLQSGQLFEEVATIHSLIGSRDQWCIRALAVGPQVSGETALFSEWSGSLCKTRRANQSGEITYIPWPKISGLQQGAPLDIKLAKDYVDAGQGQEVDKLPLLVSLGSKPRLFSDNSFSGNNPFCHYIKDSGETLPDFSSLFFNHFYCSASGKAMIEQDVKLPFMLYRQGRTPDGDTGPWVQVSSLESRINWHLYDLSKLESTVEDGIAYQLADEHFVLYRESSSTDPYDSIWQLAYRDTYPYINGYDYRYQMVSFSSRHAINAWRISPWVTAGIEGGQ